MGGQTNKMAVRSMSDSTVFLKASPNVPFSYANGSSQLESPCTSLLGPPHLSVPTCDDREGIRLQPTIYPPFMTTSSCLNSAEMIKLWDLVARFVDRRLNSKKGVYLPGLGTITFHCKKSFIGQGNYRVNMKPSFLVDGKFALVHRIHRDAMKSNSSVPTVGLIYSVFARILAVERDRVELAYNEVVQKAGALLRKGQHVIMPLRGIGEIDMCAEKVRFNFHPDFYKRNLSYTNFLIK